jgi:hypothetical protein
LGAKRLKYIGVVNTVIKKKKKKEMKKFVIMFVFLRVSAPPRKEF